MNSSSISTSIDFSSKSTGYVRVVHHYDDYNMSELRFTVDSDNPMSNLSDLSLFMIETIDPGNTDLTLYRR